MHKIFVYGTLRPGTGETVRIPGIMFDLGWYPGVVAVNDPHWRDAEFASLRPMFTAEIIEVDDAELARLDDYEGYRPGDNENSLYRRIHYEDGFLYEYNRSVGNRPRVSSGDWLAYTQQKEGCNAGIHSRR